MKNKGFTLAELLVILVILFILAVCMAMVFIRVEENVRMHSGRRCRSNLKQIGAGLAIYSSDFGRSVQYPDANGAYFLTRLYKVKLLTEPRVYLCPVSDDRNDGQDLGMETGLKPEWVSYAGRMNKVQTIYPGLFRSTYNTMTTTASDDWEAGPNHQNGQYINFLFLDGHVDHARDKTVTEDTYKTRDNEEWNLWTDPLTN